MHALRQYKIVRLICLGIIAGGMCICFAWPIAKSQTQQLVVNKALHAYFIDGDPYQFFYNLDPSNNHILIFNDTAAETIIPYVKGMKVILAPTKEDLFDQRRYEAFRVILDGISIKGNSASVGFGVYHHNCHESKGVSCELKRSFGRWKVIGCTTLM